jgi:conjugal transfer ATP-binding protein TraC
MGLFSRKKSAQDKQKELEQLIPVGEGMVNQAPVTPVPEAPASSKYATGEKPPISDPLAMYREGHMNVVDIISPNQIDIDFDAIKINDVYLRTLFISGYPRFVAPGWLEQIINFNSSLDISFFIYPVKGKDVLDDLMRKIAEMEAEISTDIERGKIAQPQTEAKLEDARRMQEELVKGIEHVYEFSFYLTIRAADMDQLNHLTKQVESTLGSILLTAKHATLDMESGFLSTSPTGLDRLAITRNMDTTSLATMFPLTSAELSGDKGVLYGINSQNGSFIIFDRFSMENSNMAVFATSGAGKSYFVKLEALRALMLGTELIILDPESEYKALCDAVGGEYVTFAFNSPAKINPFDLAGVYEEGENLLGLKILSLHGLFKVIMGDLSPTQEALLDRALVATYRSKGITTEPTTQTKEPPLMEDLYKILVGMETAEALDLAARIERFVRGGFVGIFDSQTNFDITNPFTVFSLRDMQDTLRPIAMYIILDFIWTRVKKDLKPRLLIVDEAWYMMRYKDSALFLWGIVKRARKYYLGLTTIAQDIEDFLNQDIGKAIVTNSALRVLFKQSPAAIDKIAETFILSDGEKQLLLGASVGQGIFFAGNNHAPIFVVASPEEHKLVTTKPSEILKQQEQTSQVPEQASPGMVANLTGKN